MADIDGSNAISATPAGHNSDFRSRFIGSGRDDLVLSSDRGGQTDVWRVSANGRSARPVTVSPGNKYVDDVSRDGRTLALYEDRRMSNLWLWDGATGALRQLTADAVQDLWAGASAGGISFQRTKATIERVPAILNANIVLAPLSGDRLGDARVLVDDAGLPYLAPDGQWLAYVKPAKGRGYELWLKNLQSEHAWRVTDQFTFPTLYRFPLEGLGRNVAWAPDSSALYFVAGAGPGREEVGCAVPSGSQSTLIVSGNEKGRFRDLHISSDGRSLVFVRRIAAAEQSEVVVHDVASGRETIAFARKHDRHERIFCPGWRRDGRLVVLIGTVNEDWTERVDAVEIDRGGSQTVLHLLDRGFAGTARIDPASNWIVLTGVDSGGIHNLILVTFLVNFEGGALCGPLPWFFYSLCSLRSPQPRRSR